MVTTPIWRDNVDTPLGTTSFTKRIDVNVLEGSRIIHAKMLWQVLYSRNYAKTLAHGLLSRSRKWKTAVKYTSFARYFRASNSFNSTVEASVKRSTLQKRIKCIFILTKSAITRLFIYIYMNVLFKYFHIISQQYRKQIPWKSWKKIIRERRRGNKTVRICQQRTRPRNFPRLWCNRRAVKRVQNSRPRKMDKHRWPIERAPAFVFRPLYRRHSGPR